jgi:hypothetical protein
VVCGHKVSDSLSGLLNISARKIVRCVTNALRTFCWEQNPTEADKLLKIQKDLDETKVILVSINHQASSFSNLIILYVSDALSPRFKDFRNGLFFSCQVRRSLKTAIS